MTKRRVRIALILVLAYALIMTFGGCASTLILRPPPGRIDPGSATRLMIPSDGR
jgi:hypothetical protein